MFHIVLCETVLAICWPQESDTPQLSLCSPWLRGARKLPLLVLWRTSTGTWRVTTTPSGPPSSGSAPRSSVHYNSNNEPLLLSLSTLLLQIGDRNQTKEIRQFTWPVPGNTWPSCNERRHICPAAVFSLERNEVPGTSLWLRHSCHAYRRSGPHGPPVRLS